MIGGEHLKERFSERAQHLENQPRHRGYLPGTHLRTGDTGGGYGTRTLQGNWNEERWDATYYDGKAALPTELGRTWETTYTAMTSNRTAPSPLTASLDQVTMLDVVDGTNRGFPGHQPQLDRTMPLKQSVLSTTRACYVPPAATLAQHEEHVPPVKGGSPSAQGTGILLRIRHRLLQNSNGAIMGQFTAALEKADTTGDGMLNAHELQRACHEAGIALDATEATVIIRSFERTGHGVMRAEDMLAQLRGDLGERRGALVRKAFALLARVTGGVVRYGTMLSLYDASQHPEVLDGTRTEAQVRDVFVRQWPQSIDAEAVIEEKDFVRCYANMGFEISSEQLFERIVRNTWHVSGGEGKCANTSCRRVQVVHTNGRVSMQEVKDDLGVGDSMEKIVANLTLQGLKDIAKVELNPVQKRRIM